MSDSYGPSLTPPWRVEKVTRRAGQPRLRVAHRASSSAVSSSSSRPDTSPSSLRRSVSSSARPTAGPSGTPAASRSSPDDLEAARRAGRSPSGGSARTGAPQRQGQRERLGRLAARAASRSSDGVCSRSRSACAIRSAPRAPRATPRRARRRVRLRSAEPQVERLGSARHQRRQRRSARGRRRSPAAPSAAEATRSGSGSSAGWRARVELEVAQQLARPSGASVSREQVHQLVADARARDRARARPPATASRASRSVSGSSAKPSRVS